MAEDKETKKESSKKKKENKEPVDITFGDAETIMGIEAYKTIQEKSFKRKKRYWITRILDRIERRMKRYFDGRQKVIDDCSIKDDNDNPAQDELGRIRWQPSKQKKATKELNAMRDDKLDVEFDKVVLEDGDVPEDLTLGEEKILLYIASQPDMEK